MTFRTYIKKWMIESESHSVLFNVLRPHGLYSPWNSPGQNTGVGRLTLLQRIYSTKESNWDLLYCRWVFYQLSYKGSPGDRMKIVYCFMKIKTMASRSWKNKIILCCTRDTSSFAIYRYEQGTLGQVHALERGRSL